MFVSLDDVPKDALSEAIAANIERDKRVARLTDYFQRSIFWVRLTCIAAVLCCVISLGVTLWVVLNFNSASQSRSTRFTTILTCETKAENIASHNDYVQVTGVGMYEAPVNCPVPK